jgi:hypothetical protein
VLRISEAAATLAPSLHNALRRGLDNGTGLGLLKGTLEETSSNPIFALRDFARILPNSAAISALNATRKTLTNAESRSITQFLCPKLTENSRLALISLA